MSPRPGFRQMAYALAAALGVAAAVVLAVRLWPGTPPAEPPSAVPAAGTPNALPASAHEAGAACTPCHTSIVETYRRHGMSRSVGPAGPVTPGVVAHPDSGTRYEIAADDSGVWLTATASDGGARRQRIVGRIGAGIFDTSWVTSEVDQNGEVMGRLYFAPVETVAGSGLQLSPFEQHAASPGMDMPLTRDCLTCHTVDPLTATFPANLFGSGAFDRIGPLGCGSCHGSVDRHAAIMRGQRGAQGEGLGVARLGRLDPGAQRDVCARCHLQGDARLDLVGGTPDRSAPLAGQIPVLVPARAQTDFRFVGQIERLALSACFKGTPAMTCTTCHDPHTAVREQGTASFDRACTACHQALPSHTAAMTGCVGCHVRRSQPFDLPHVRTADHFIRRRIEPPQDDVPHRQFAAREGAVELYDDGRLRPALATPAGRRWRSGVLAMGLMTMGRFAEAGRHFDAFPPAGSPEARTPFAPDGLAPVETSAAFHTVRGLGLMGRGRIDEATRALSDAIALDPGAADARLARARLRFDAGDLRGALLDTETVIRTYPLAEAPWDLRIEIARRSGRPDLALSAADASTRLFPSNPRAWAALAVLARGRGDAERARRALDRARALSPSVAAAAAAPGTPE